METLKRRWFQKKNNQKKFKKIYRQNQGSCGSNSFLVSSIFCSPPYINKLDNSDFSSYIEYLYFIYIFIFSFGNTYEGTRGPGCLLTGLEKNVFYISYNSNFDIYFYKCFFLFNFEIFRPGHILGNGGCGCLLPEAVKA